MTKIKNTKKGMAKKTLSISLAVAMLATSNVPVWAAEFTDGSEAAFTSEAPAEVVDEAPVVDETVENIPEATAVDSVYDVTFETEKGKFETNMEWGKEYNASIKVTEKNGNALDTAKLKVRWVNSDNLAEVPWGSAEIGSVYFNITDTNKAEATVSGINFSNKDWVGGVYKLQVYEVDSNGKIINVAGESAPITVAKRTIKGSITRNHQNQLTYADAVKYTGTGITTVPKYNMSAVTWTDEGNTVDSSDIKGVNDYQIIGEKDIINTNEFHAPATNNITATGKIDSKYYQGEVDVHFSIWRKEGLAKDAVKVELPKYTYQFTGNNIVVPAKDVIVTEKLTGKVVEGASTDFTVGAWVGDSSAKASVNQVNSLLNYVANDGWNGTVPVEGDLKIVKRDLEDTVNTIVEIPTMTQDDHTNTTEITANEVWNKLSVKDISGAEVNKYSVQVKFANNADKITVADGGVYTAYISAANGYGDHVTGVREVSFKVQAHDLNAAKFVNEDRFFQGATYTGKQHTFGLTKDNLKEKLGELRISTASKTLVPGTDYDTNITFGENVDAGKGYVYINGLGSYAGTQKVITFDIAKRDATKVVVPEKITFNPSYIDVDEYDVATSVIAEYKEGKEDVSLTVPSTDYKVERRFVKDKNGTALNTTDDANQVGQYIETTITLTNSKNFKHKNGETVLKGYTRIAYKSIGEADVQLVKTDYTYTGKEIFPEYKVVVDGETLVLDKDFTADVSHAVNVGEAILTITGIGEYDNSSVSKKFNIVPADISTLTVEASSNVVYNGTQWIGKKTTNELSFKLGENKINATEFAFAYPTSKSANINAGNGTVTLKPAKDNKNFVGSKEFTFTIAPAKISADAGELSAYDKFGSLIDIANEKFAYTGEANTFAKTKYEYSVTSPMKFTVNDYDIIYRDNIAGNNHKGHILVVAKGNYAAERTYTCANGDVVKNVVIDKSFEITPINVGYDAHIAVNVENGSYAEGKNVDPVVNITYKGKKLVEGVDYKLDYARYYSQDRTKVTNGKTLKVDIKGIGGYTGEVYAKEWGIDKFDLANAEVVVKGTDAEPVVKVLNRGVVVDPSEYDLVAKDGKATITAKKDSKNYTGTQTFEIKEALAKPAAPMIETVKVDGNKATVVLSGEAEGATGYDYVISPNKNCINDKDYTKVLKNKLTTDTTFQYVDQGMYYAYCHAWTRDENGKKVFGEWSNAYPFSVTSITPSQPVVTSVKVKGSTVTVTYTKSVNAEGYDVVLGSKTALVAGEKRPVEYGKLVKKNISGNTVTATFKNVKKGTYYAGLHSFNRTSEDGKKVFSPWSNVKRIVVK